MPRLILKWLSRLFSSVYLFRIQLRSSCVADNEARARIAENGGNVWFETSENSLPPLVLLLVALTAGMLFSFTVALLYFDKTHRSQNRKDHEH